jgi:hypothetical protein
MPVKIAAMKVYKFFTVINLELSFFEPARVTIDP